MKVKNVKAKGSTRGAEVIAGDTGQEVKQLRRTLQQVGGFERLRRSLGLSSRYFNQIGREQQAAMRHVAQITEQVKALDLTKQLRQAQQLGDQVIKMPGALDQIHHAQKIAGQVNKTTDLFRGVADVASRFNDPIRDLMKGSAAVARLSQFSGPNPIAELRPRSNPTVTADVDMTPVKLDLPRVDVPLHPGHETNTWLKELVNVLAEMRDGARKESERSHERHEEQRRRARLQTILMVTSLTVSLFVLGILAYVNLVR